MGKRRLCKSIRFGLYANSESVIAYCLDTSSQRDEMVRGLAREYNFTSMTVSHAERNRAMDRRTFVATGLSALSAFPKLQAAPLPNRPAAPNGIVLFTRNRQILYVDESGRTVHRFDAATLAGKDWLPVAVSPNGTRAALLEDQAGRDTSKDRRLRIEPLVRGVPPVEIPEATPAEYCFLWSADGKRLIGSREVQPGGAMSPSYPRNIDINLETGRWVDLPLVPKEPNHLPFPMTVHRIHDWSPDGQWILTIVRRGTSSSVLHLVSRDGKTARPLTDGESDVRHARFSPDGKTVLYDRVLLNPMAIGSRPGLLGRWSGYLLELLTLRLAGGTPVQIAQIQMQSQYDKYVQFAWRPDGRRIVYMYQEFFGRPCEEQMDRPHLVFCDSDGGNRKSRHLASKLDDWLTIHNWY